MEIWQMLINVITFIKNISLKWTLPTYLPQYLHSLATFETLNAVFIVVKLGKQTHRTTQSELKQNTFALVNSNLLQFYFLFMASV